MYGTEGFISTFCFSVAKIDALLAFGLIPWLLKSCVNRVGNREVGGRDKLQPIARPKVAD